MNRKGKPIVALIYDFDGTLAPGNMQEYSFINAVGMGKEEFWGETHKMARGQDADGILIYMLFMLQEAKKKGLSITRDSLRQFGKAITFYKGVESWFSRINKIGQKEGVIVEHYINSSGLLEIMEGSRIAKEFKTIFASSYYYSKKGNAIWPAAAVNYTNKTQFLFKINKGILNISDSEKINASVPEDEKRVAFSNMIYFGDGETDVPCMKLTRQLGGSSIAVYDPQKKEKKKIAQLLLAQNRVNFSCPADYSRGSKIEEIVINIIRKIKADDQLSKVESE
ncbi:MAG: haloacid dehalogenase-like hydrolase [Bacteroidales bacterium]|nr:haloacid dehalogenase-like hydrolase [Bacteroidales bacterium]